MSPFRSPFTTVGTGVPDANGVGCTGPGNVCPDFRPFQRTGKETLTDYEIGAKTDWAIGTVRGRLNLAAFLSKYQDALQFFNIVGTGKIGRASCRERVSQYVEISVVAG